MRRILVVGFAALLTAACASSPTSTPASSGSAAVGSPPATTATSAPAAPATSAAASAHDAGLPSCATTDLTVTIGTSQGTAGSVYQPIVFTNSGTASCTLYGYPGVSLGGGSPVAQIGAAAARSTTTAASIITLAPGAAANALLQYTEAGNYSPSTCDPTPATELIIFPPNQTVSASVAYSNTACASTSVDILHVGAVTAGTGG